MVVTPVTVAPVATVLGVVGVLVCPACTFVRTVVKIDTDGVVVTTLVVALVTDVLPLTVCVAVMAVVLQVPEGRRLYNLNCRSHASIGGFTSDDSTGEEYSLQSPFTASETYARDPNALQPGCDEHENAHSSSKCGLAIVTIILCWIAFDHQSGRVYPSLTP